MAFVAKLNSLFSRRSRRQRLRKQKEDSESKSNNIGGVPWDKRWRHSSDLDSWVRATSPYIRWDGPCLRDFKASYNPPNSGFPEWLLRRAEEYMKTLQELFEQAGITGIDWFKFPVSNRSVDQLIWIFALLLQISPHMPPLDPHTLYLCYMTLRGWLPEPINRPDPAFDTLDSHNQSLCVARFGRKEAIADPPKPQFGGQWRNCQTVDDFARFFNLDDDVKVYITPPGSKIGPDFRAWLQEGAKEYLHVVLRYLTKGEWEGGWDSDPTTFSEDALIHSYAELLKISPHFEMRRLSSYHEALLKLLPVWIYRRPLHSWKDGLFPRRSLHDATGPLYGQILHRFQEFNTHRDELYRGVAPYAALVGPEGYGKSFFVRQMAVQGYTYVVYLLPQTEKTHLQWTGPEHRTLANPPPCEGLPNRQRILECFIAVSLANVKLCRDVGIGPRAFFDMQTENWRLNTVLKEFRKVLWQAFESMTQAAHRVAERMRPPGCQDEDDKYWKPALKYCLNMYTALMWRKFFKLRAVLPIYQPYHDYPDPPSGDTALRDGSPAMVLCIDERYGQICWLPDKELKWEWYNELLKATSNWANKQWDAPEDRFFVLSVHAESSDMPPKPNHPFQDIQIEHLK